MHLFTCGVFLDLSSTPFHTKLECYWTVFLQRTPPTRKGLLLTVKQHHIHHVSLRVCLQIQPPNHTVLFLFCYLSIRTKCLCDGRRQSVSKQREQTVERRQAERRRRRGERKEALTVTSRQPLPYLACCGAYGVQR